MVALLCALALLAAMTVGVAIKFNLMLAIGVLLFGVGMFVLGFDAHIRLSRWP